MSVERNRHITLHCQAQGVPTPTVVWKKATGMQNSVCLVCLWSEFCCDFVDMFGIMYLTAICNILDMLSRQRPTREYLCAYTYIFICPSYNIPIISYYFTQHPATKYDATACAGSKSGDYEEVRERPYTKLLSNGSLLLQHVKEDREGFYMCQAQNGIGTGIGKVVQLKVNCKFNYKQIM